MQTQKKEEGLIHAVAEMIRTHSRDAKLMTAAKLEDELRDKWLSFGGEPEVMQDMEEILKRALQEHEDLRVVTGQDELPFYYSLLYVSQTYAIIMACKASPLRLIAETVRKNAALYPRPVPLDMFQASPFDLKPEEIQAALGAMASQDQYNDIAFSMTSVGTVYLYSTKYMDHRFAALLAERDDVDLLHNP